MTSSVSTQTIAFATVDNFSCVGEYNGIVLSASGNGYVNSNNFTHIALYNQVNAVFLTTAGTTGASINSNKFTDLHIQWSHLWESTSQLAGIYQQYSGSGTANAEPIRNNEFKGLSLWDIRSNGYAINLADGASTRNFHEGYIYSESPTMTGISDNSGGSSNLYHDLNNAAWYTGSGTAGSLLNTSTTQMIQAGSSFTPMGLIINTIGRQFIPEVSCMTAPSVGATCNTTVNLSPGMPDRSYRGFCSMLPYSGSGYIVQAYPTSLTQATITIKCDSAVAFNGELDCLFVHR